MGNLLSSSPPHPKQDISGAQLTVQQELYKELSGNLLWCTTGDLCTTPSKQLTISSQPNQPIKLTSNNQAIKVQTTPTKDALTINPDGTITIAGDLIVTGNIQIGNKLQFQKGPWIIGPSNENHLAVNKLNNFGLLIRDDASIFAKNLNNGSFDPSNNSVQNSNWGKQWFHNSFTP